MVLLDRYQRAGTQITLAQPVTLTVLRSANGLSIYHMTEDADKLEKIYIAYTRDMQQYPGKRFIVSKDPIHKQGMLVLFDRMIRNQVTMEDVMNFPPPPPGARNADIDADRHYDIGRLTRANCRRKCRV
jgi:hypothetical protein